MLSNIYYFFGARLALGWACLVHVLPRGIGKWVYVWLCAWDPHALENGSMCGSVDVQLYLGIIFFKFKEIPRH